MNELAGFVASLKERGIRRVKAVYVIEPEGHFESHWTEFTGLSNGEEHKLTLPYRTFDTRAPLRDYAPSRALPVAPAVRNCRHYADAKGMATYLRRRGFDVEEFLLRDGEAIRITQGMRRKAGKVLGKYGYLAAA